MSTTDNIGLKPAPGNGSCIRAGIPESDTGESGEESEPTYRHYDNFETDVCLTQDEDDDADDHQANVVHNVGTNLQAVGKVPVSALVTSKPPARESPARVSVPRDTGMAAMNNRGVSSDSDSCTESELTQGQGQITDDTTTTTSTSESEETQIWVPVSKRPSARHVTDTTTPPHSSNGSDASRPQSYIYKAGSPAPTGNAVGTAAYSGMGTGTSQGERGSRHGPHGVRAGSSDSARRDSRDSWHNLQSNLQSSGVQKRVSPTKQVSVGLLRHDDTTGTITLDIRNVANTESGLGQTENEEMGGQSDEAIVGTGAAVNTSMLRSKAVSRTQQAPQENMSFLETICMICSALYMLFMVVLGLVVPLAKVFVTQTYPILFEGFYIYMYMLSIAFLAYVYTYLLRLRTPRLKRRGRTVVSSIPVSNRRRATPEIAEEQTGSFYLRLGAVAFGIGSMIKSGLHFGEYFEMTTAPECGHILYGIRPIMHLCFTFIQLYFVFLNSKMFTRRYKYLARFGLMHMVATNMVVWLEEVAKETLREISRADTHDRNVTTAGTVTPGGRVLVDYEALHCQGNSLMGDVVETSSPYLYPCSILYSIICACILFVMWHRLGNKNRSASQDTDESRSKERSYVDCSSSSRGLFLGIIVFVAAVIMLITFFVLVRTNQHMSSAVRLQHLGDVSIYVVTIVCVILAFHRTHGMRYPHTRPIPRFEDALLVVTLIGVFILCVANIIAGVLTDVTRYGHLIILSNSMRVIQVIMQTVFLLTTMHKTAWKREQAEKKPGREFVTFLLICNIALWGMTIFDVQRSEANPVQLGFYGLVAWNIITHVSLPFSILFRFHSTVCLANIWKHAWKLPT